MRHIPVVFPILLAAIVLLTFFTGVYAIAEAAANGRQAPDAGSPAPAQQTATDRDPGAADLQWYERAAILVCPLH